MGSKRDLLQAKIGPVDGQSLPCLSRRVQAEPAKRVTNLLVGEQKVMNAREKHYQYQTVPFEIFHLAFGLVHVYAVQINVFGQKYIIC